LGLEGGRSGTVGRRSPGCFFWVLRMRSIRKPDQHRRHISQQELLVVLLRFQKFCCRSVSVGFARKPRFSVRFWFLSVPFSSCRQCGTFMQPTAHQTCSSTLHISVYNSSRQQQVSNSVGLVAWKPPPVPNVTRVAKRYLSGSLRRRHPLLVSICTARRQACSQTDVTDWVQKKLICCSLSSTTCLWSVLNTEYSLHEIDHWHVVLNKWALTVTLYSWLISRIENS